MLIFLAFLLVWASVSDLKNRIVPNSLMVLILIVVFIYAYQYALLNKYAFAWSGIMLASGIFLSMFNILGGADSKLIAVLLLAVEAHNLILFPIFLAILILVSTIIYWVFSSIHSVKFNQKGLPLVPAISVAGFLCIWIG